MSEAEREFWERYAQLLVSKCITGHVGEWYLRRAQEFACGLNGLKLADVNSTYLDHWIDEIGGRRNLEDWQVRQAICAVRLLIEDLSGGALYRPQRGIGS